MDPSNHELKSLHPNFLSEFVDVHRSGPRSSPLVFVNYSNNPGVKANAARQKPFMSRWATLNSCRHPSRTRYSSAPGTPSRSPAPIDKFKEPKRMGRKHVLSATCSPSVAGPTEVVSAASKDPFDSLPLKIDEQTWQLLNYWLDARGGSPAREAYRHQVAAIRKKICFPLIASSPVTLVTAITWIEQTIHTGFPRSVIVSRLSQALPELHQSLTDLDHATGPQTLLSIVLLMNVAANLHDLDSLRAHFLGLAALLSRQPALHTENYFTRKLVNSWAFSYGSAAGHSSLPDFFQFDAGSCAVEANPRAGTALHKLHQQCLLLDKFYLSLPDLFLLRPLLDLAVTDQISPVLAADLLRCIWTGSLKLALALLKCTMRIEKCCWYALTLNFLSEIDHCAEENLAGLSGLIYAQLKRMDIDQTLRKTPEFVLWVSLSAQSLLSNRFDASWLLQVITKSCVALDVRQYSDAKLVCETFLWSPHLDKHVHLLFRGGEDGDQSSKNDASRIDDYTDTDDTIEARLDRSTASQVSGPCTLCMRQDCPCPLTRGDDGELNERMKHHLGMIWSTVDGFRKMCDQPWVDDDVEQNV